MSKTLIWWAPFCAGGIGDRLLGMISTYCIAKHLKRDFLIKWDHLDMSSAFTIDPRYDYYTYNYPYIEIICNNLESQEFFKKKENLDKLENVPHILIWSNQNLFQYLFTEWDEKYKETLITAFSQTFIEFLHPIGINLIPNLENMIGIHVRTKDTHFYHPERKYDQIPYIKDILSRCKTHIETYNPKEKLIFIASDCDVTYFIARQIFGNEYTIVNNKGKIIHSMIDTEKDGLKKVITDLLSLGKTKSLYLGWNTNFPKVGGLLNGKRQFYNYEYPSCPREIYNFSFIELANYFSQGGREGKITN